ncbi:MAG: diaminopimelate decarboxylase [Peptococcaceae bacterium]|nr:diaminopimelate decarboxylase [Peptococcaceae bacterium]
MDVSKTLPFDLSTLEKLTQTFETPFHIYDEQAIRDNARRFLRAFDWIPFKQYFAVKATPNPYIMKILKEEGIGADCSSMAELVLADRVGLTGAEIVFSSNNTPADEYRKARELGVTINLDDISHIDFLDREAGLPELLSFRCNPGSCIRGKGNTIIGAPEEAKFGLTRDQIFQAYALAQKKGVERFGMHTMVVSNELDMENLVQTAQVMFDLAAELSHKLSICLEFINLGGGVGIPYHPEQQPVNLEKWAESVQRLYEKILLPLGMKNPTTLATECGRVITGPYGYLVSRVLHKKAIYKDYVGLDASMADLMRPGLYGAYHHITVLGKEEVPHDFCYDVTGGLCENNDKFATDRMLPPIEVGDLLVIHDTGAHGQAMGFNYNGKLRPKELLLKPDGSVQMIRRAETLEDLFATLDFKGV